MISILLGLITLGQQDIVIPPGEYTVQELALRLVPVIGEPLEVQKNLRDRVLYVAVNRQPGLAILNGLSLASGCGSIATRQSIGCLFEKIRPSCTRLRPSLTTRSHERLSKRQTRTATREQSFCAWQKPPGIVPSRLEMRGTKNRINLLETLLATGAGTPARASCGAFSLNCPTLVKQASNHRELTISLSFLLIQMWNSNKRFARVFRVLPAIKMRHLQIT